MQFIGSIVIIILLFQYDRIISAPTDTAAPGEHEIIESQLIDPSMLQGAQHNHKTDKDKEPKKGIDYYEYRNVVADGVQKALDECRQKFKWDRWNCPKKAFLGILDREEFSMGQGPLPSNKELGLTRALIASGIVLSMIKSCSIGTNALCGCTNPIIVNVQGNEAFLATQTDMAATISTATRSSATQTKVPDFVQQSLTNLQLTNLQVANLAGVDLESKERELSEQEAALMLQGLSISTKSINQDTNQPFDIEKSKDAKFVWAGCEETVRFGFKVAKMYLDSQDTVQGEASRLISTHNYEAGRQAVKKSMKRKCKCHGPSGTCQVHTCWTVVPDIAEVGEQLKKQYSVAAKVGAISAKETDAASLVKELSSIGPEKLVFADASPDYCYENKQLGINGTLGRFCSRTRRRSDGTEVSRSERDSCDRLCTKCGYKIKKEKIRVEKQCDCRFVYCCSVECKRCPVIEDSYKCVRHS